MESKILRHDGKVRGFCFVGAANLRILANFASENIEPLGDSGMQVAEAWNKYKDSTSTWQQKYLCKNLTVFLEWLSELGYQTYDA